MALSLYNPVRNHFGGHRFIHPGMQCAVCLYSVGLGCKVIGRIIRASPDSVTKWVKKTGGLDPQRLKNAYRRRRSRGLFASAKPKQTKEERNAKAVEYTRIKRRSDHGFRLRVYCGTRIYQAVKKQKTVKSERTLNLIGCSVDYLREYLASMFEAGMSWDNYGDWHIDHIIPCASFDLTDPKQQKLCFHFSNLRPAWARENIVKGDTMPDNPQLGLLLNT